MSQVAALIHVSAGVLNIAYYESGPADGMPTILLHGFPYDDVAMTLSTSGNRCIAPFLRGYGQTPVSVARNAALRGAGGTGRRFVGTDGQPVDRKGDLWRIRLGWPRRLHCCRAMAGKGAGTGQRRRYLQQPGHRWRPQSGFARSGGARLVPILFPYRSGPQGLDPRTGRSDMAFRSSNANTCSHR